jgi:hypothetical protein
VLVAAVILVLAGVVTTAIMLANGGGDPPQAKVVLTPVSPGDVEGTVAMRESGSAQAMEVDTSLGAAPSDHYYEVWLLDRETGKMLPVGVLPPDGRGTFRLPSEILAGYDSVDISLQPNDGSTNHSTDSIMRASYSGPRRASTSRSSPPVAIRDTRRRDDRRRARGHRRGGRREPAVSADFDRQGPRLGVAVALRGRRRRPPARRLRAADDRDGDAQA